VVAPEATFSSVEASIVTVLKDLEAYMAKQHNHSTGAEDDLDVIEGITTALNALAEGLDDLAESIGPTDEDYAEIQAGNAGKTAQELAEEDEIVEQIIGPFTRALDDMTTLINNAAMEITAIAAEAAIDPSAEEEPETRDAEKTPVAFIEDKGKS
jgi:hypothetical protein